MATPCLPAVGFPHPCSPQHHAPGTPPASHWVLTTCVCLYRHRTLHNGLLPLHRREPEQPGLHQRLRVRLHPPSHLRRLLLGSLPALPRWAACQLHPRHRAGTLLEHHHARGLPGLGVAAGPVRQVSAPCLVPCMVPALVPGWYQWSTRTASQRHMLGCNTCMHHMHHMTSTTTAHWLASEPSSMQPQPLPRPLLPLPLPLLPPPLLLPPLLHAPRAACCRCRYRCCLLLLLSAPAPAAAAAAAASKTPQHLLRADLCIASCLSKPWGLNILWHRCFNHYGLRVGAARQPQIRPLCAAHPPPPPPSLPGQLDVVPVGQRQLLPAQQHPYQPDHPMRQCHRSGPLRFAPAAALPACLPACLPAVLLAGCLRELHPSPASWQGIHIP